MFDEDGVDFSALKNLKVPARKPGQTPAEYIAEHCPNLRDATGKTSATAFILPTDRPLAKPKDKANRSRD